MIRGCLFACFVDCGLRRLGVVGAMFALQLGYFVFGLICLGFVV